MFWRWHHIFCTKMVICSYFIVQRRTWLAYCETSTRKVISHSLDVDLFRGEIHGCSCKNNNLHSAKQRWQLTYSQIQDCTFSIAKNDPFRTKCERGTGAFWDLWIWPIASCIIYAGKWQSVSYVRYWQHLPFPATRKCLMYTVPVAEIITSAVVIYHGNIN